MSSEGWGGAPTVDDRWTALLHSPRGRGLRALGHPEFRLVWGTFVVGQLGFWIAFISLQALMARLTGSDGRWLGLLFFLSFIPMLVFTPLAGVLADRMERKRILVVGFSCSCLLMLGLAVATTGGKATPLLLLPFAFGIGTVFAFNAPASQSVVANSVHPDALASAMSLQAVGANLSRVVGPTLAGPVLALWGEGAAFVIQAVSSAIVVLLLRRLQLSPFVPEIDASGFWSRVRAGIDHARERPPAVALLSVLCMSSLFAAGYMALLPMVADETFGRGPGGFTSLAAVTGLGSMLGALATGFREEAPSLRGSTILVACFGGSIVAFGLAPNWPLALVSIAVVGFFYFWGMTSLNALLHGLVDDAKRGRVASLWVIGWGGLVPIGALWQAVVAESFGVRQALVLAGGVTALWSLGAVLLRRRRNRALPSAKLP